MTARRRRWRSSGRSNAYGWSKHLFDRRVARLVERGTRTRPQWAGLKFFNVYGPNEYHKGAMHSVVAQIYPRAQAGEPAQLFRSHRAGIPDGGQQRDFVYVARLRRHDAVALRPSRGERPLQIGQRQGAQLRRSGGRGVSARWAASRKIEYIDTPVEIRDKYQYFTEAQMAGCAPPATTGRRPRSRTACAHYVQTYLAAPILINES